VTEYIDINHHQLQRYLDMRRKVDPEIRLLHSLADLLAQLEHAAPERTAVDPVTVGVVNATMARRVLAIQAALDDFLLAGTAEALIEGR
jgi:hypothetical protein